MVNETLQLCSHKEMQDNMTQEMIDELNSYDLTNALFSVLIILTNLSVVISSGLLVKKYQEPRCTYLLLGNISMADLLIGISILCGLCLKKLMFWNTITCCIAMGIYMTIAITSLYSLVMIAVDRFLYILHGIKYNQMVYPKRVRFIIGGIWISAIFVSTFSIISGSDNTMNGKACWIPMVISPTSLLITSILGEGSIIIVVVIYGILLKNAIQKAMQIKRMIQETSNNEEGTENTLRFFKGGSSKQTISEMVETQIQSDNDDENKERKGLSKIFQRRKSSVSANKNNPTKWKAIKVVLFTTIGFIITWIPYYVAALCLIMCDEYENLLKCHYIKVSILSRTGLLTLVNSIINPVVYAWWHNGFRQGIKKIIERRRLALFG